MFKTIWLRKYLLTSWLTILNQIEPNWTKLNHFEPKNCFLKKTLFYTKIMIKLFFWPKGGPLPRKMAKFFFFQIWSNHAPINRSRWVRIWFAQIFLTIFDQIWTFNYSKFSAEFKSFLQNSVCFSSSKRIQILVSLISENQLYVIF